MTDTHLAIEVSKPGVFTQVRKPLVDTGFHQVRIRVDFAWLFRSPPLPAVLNEPRTRRRYGYEVGKRQRWLGHDEEFASAAPSVCATSA